MKTPEGWKLVPVEPTEEMLVAALVHTSYEPHRKEGLKEEIATDYRLMLAAAPTPPAQSHHELDDADIRAIALDCGFKLKPQPDGLEDLNPYVYKFARELLATIPSAESVLALRERLTPPAREVNIRPLSEVMAEIESDPEMTACIDDMRSKARSHQSPEGEEAEATAQETDYPLISRFKELGWSVSDSVYKAHIAQVLPLQNQPEVTVTTTARDDEPVAWDMLKMNSFGTDAERRTALESLRAALEGK